MDEKVFNGQLDVKSSSAKEEIRQVINNNFTAGIIQTGSGSIQTPNSTVASNINGALSEEVKTQLLGIANSIEQAAKETDEEFDEIAEDIISIRRELTSLNPQTHALKNTFKAIGWSAKIACKAAIEQFVEKAIVLLG